KCNPRTSSLATSGVRFSRKIPVSLRQEGARVDRPVTIPLGVLDASVLDARLGRGERARPLLERLAGAEVAAEEDEAVCALERLVDRRTLGRLVPLGREDVGLQRVEAQLARAIHEGERPIDRLEGIVEPLHPEVRTGESRWRVIVPRE